jgi:cellulose synthase/poly-beta-1,6-N-acetylglucosamine synthase-like glycosyltransferase
MATSASTRLDDVSVVIPTIGRPSLHRLLVALSRQPAPVNRVVVVDDRSMPAGPVVVPEALAGRTTVLSSGGRGPAAARNLGWRATDSPWIAFLDDDVVPSPAWAVQLEQDLAVDPDVAATQGRIVVPLPGGRRPTDRERNVARLEGAEWITADMAVRRSALEAVAGFDERFRRAYREDSDLALRLVQRGWRLEAGARQSTHPVQPAPWWTSVSAQRGNRDDALMLALHGRDWRRERGRRGRHTAVTAAAVTAAVLARRGHRRLAALSAAGWLAGTAEFAARRIAPGPRRLGEVMAMLLTSVLIPPTAAAYWAAGRIAYPSRWTRQWDVSNPSRSGHATRVRR